MDDHTEQSGAHTADRSGAGPDARRLPADRASTVLERAAALDAKRSSEVEVDHLREAATAAGISPEAFDEAMREQDDAPPGSPPSGQAVAPALLRAPGPAQIEHYAGLLRDLLGDEAQVTVVEDRIEARDADGIVVSITPRSGHTTVATGRLRRRLLAIALPALIPAFLGFLLMFEEEDPGIGIMLGVLGAVIAAIIGTTVSHHRERKALQKKVERLRRQLQRMLEPPRDER